MRKAGRLSKRYFRIMLVAPTDEALSWKRWSTTSQRYTSKKQGHAKNRPLVLPDFTVIQRHGGHGMATAVRSDLSKAVSSLNSVK